MDKMIDPVDLQAFLNKIEGGSVAVDLLKIGQKYHQENAPSGNKNSKYNGNFRVALDIEDCLDRFYGGYYSDWACGGQWNRAYQFVQLLANAFKNAHVEVIVFFDGTMKKNKKLSFERNDFRQKTISVLKHIRMIGTPPPKIWWLPPSGIKTTLRNALRSVNIQVAQTVTDHTIEIIEYFQEQKLDAILGLHPDYIIANTSRYFSSHDLRLSYKGALETKEFMVSKLLSSLKLTADHLPFIAVFLGGYTLIDDIKLKSIYECLKIDASLDFETRIRKIAEIVRNSPTTDIDEFIKQLNLENFENDIKESVEYYQRRGKFSGKKYLGQKKRHGNNSNNNVNNNNTNDNINKSSIIIESTPFASETNENDEIARKMLNEVSNLVDDESAITITTTCNSNLTNNTPNTSGNSSKSNKSDNKETSSNNKNIQPFVYTLPGEVLKTSLTRHQRGIMDARIYQLLTVKEIILPQILEDEQYREIPAVHLFYRPARQMIYAILFNMYHQKYLCSKRNTSGGVGNDKKDGKKDKKELSAVIGHQQQQKPPEIQVAEWIWSPQNEYKKPEYVTANPLPWAVPTIQRLWFGMAFEDKQRRMKAFLTVMRSDSTLMLNRGYVPQHMLVMACVLRYIVTSPDRNILTRQELDAFLATAFSPQLPMVEFTQELVLPGVHLRGVYLATLFMQGVETASLANDACGVPLPWTMINPWLFFDGKLFHLKLKMSTYVATLRELCDDHIEIVLKIERFRKAILEDVEHFLLPAAHIDPMYRPGFLPQPTLPLAGYSKNTTAAASLHQLTAANTNGALFYNPQTSYFSLSQALMHHNPREIVTGVNPPLISGRNNNNRNNNGTQQQRQNNRKGYQLKVGGIVTGSWAAANGNAAAAAAAVAAANRTLFGPPGNRLGNRLAGNLAGRLGLQHNRNVNNKNNGNNNGIRLPRNANQNNITGRSLSRAYGNKMNNRNRNRNKRKDNRKNKSNGNNNNDSSKKDNTVTNKDEIKKTTTTTTTTITTTDTNSINKTTTTAETNLNISKIETKTDIDNVSEKLKDLELGLSSCTVELQNGTIVLASDLANSMCDVILKDEEEDDNDAFNEETRSDVTTTQSPIKNTSTIPTTPTKILQNNKNIMDITTNHNNNNNKETLVSPPPTTTKFTNLNKTLDSSIDAVLNHNNNNNTNINSEDIGGSGDNINNNNDKNIINDTADGANSITTNSVKNSIIIKKPIGKKNGTANNDDNDVDNSAIVGGLVDIDEIGQGDVSVKG